MSKITKKKPGQKDQKSLSLGTEKLASSGLTLEDAEELSIHCLSGKQTSSLHNSFKDLCALKIDYMGVDGKPLSDWPKSKPFYRLRYLEYGTDFTQLTDKKVLRYVQEPGTAPVAYYPSNQDWSDIVGDVDQPLIITEGELKAAKACKEGFPTIGLGGVYNWRSYKIGIEWLPSLDFVNWVKRNVYICFDSDYKSNENVCAALRLLAEELQDRGSFVYVVTLPNIPGFDKVGLDDFLTFSGPSAVDTFRELLSYAEPLGLSRPLWSLNDKYVYVQNPGLVIDQQTKFKVSPSAFKEHLESPLNYQERVLKPDGSISYKSVSAAASWLKWSLRKEVNKITYSPGQGEFISQPLLFNIWPGWGCEAKKGNVKLFIELIDHLFTNAEPEAKNWFLQWCAYPLQNPGHKLFSSAVLHGVRHGTGKSLVGYTLGRIYGKNFTEISQGDLHNSFNEWAEAKQFIMGDDITGSNKRQDADLLKKMITQRELRVNTKFIPSYVVPDCINYFFTANHPDSFFLEDDDRRFFIHEVQVGPMNNEFYTRYNDWLDNDGGAEAVFHYLLNLDMKGFNPSAPALKTAAKERMIANVQSDLGAWVRSLLATPDHILKVGELKMDKDLFTSKELLAIYDPIGRTGTTANGLGRELARAGIRQVANGRPVRLSDGSQGRYYIIRNHDYWLREQTTAKAIQHLDGWFKQQPEKKPKY